MKKTLITILTVVLFLFAYSMLKIRSDVKMACFEAINIFEGDCVDALLQITTSVNHDYEQKNHAIWALGQLADERALPVLNEFLKFSYPEIPCKVSIHICKEEVEKAIKWCTKGNITSWMYDKLKGERAEELF